MEDKWEEIAKAYIPDGIREFQDFPSAFDAYVSCLHQLYFFGTAMQLNVLSWT